MTRARCWMAIALAALLVTAATAQADVKTQQKTQVKFEGMLGRMMGLFGGNKDAVQTVVVKGDRKATMGGEAGQIVDLTEEKVYELNLKNKTYKVVTFAEMRRKLEEARAEAEKQARKSEGREKDPNQKEMQVDFSLKETGQKREINGYSCRQVVMTIAVHEKGRPIEQAGGLLMTVDNWMAPAIPAMKEIADFEVRYARKLNLDAPSAADLAQAMAMYPGLKDAMVKLQNEKVNMNGTPIQTIMTVQNVMTPEQAQAKKEEAPSGGGVIGGMLGRFGRKKADDSKSKDAVPASAAPAGDNKATFMTSTVDVLSVSTAVDSADLQVPAGFREK